MKQDVLSVKDGASVSQLTLSKTVFDGKVNDHLIYEAIKAELANARQGTASTKDRSKIKGTGAKPYRQKGTGRARAGTKKSPIWVGGGTVFGPQPRSYKTKIPKKMKLTAMRSLLNKKALAKNIKIIEDFTFETGRTKDIINILNKVCAMDRVVLIIADNDALVKRATRNIPWVKCYNSKRLTFKDVFYAKEVIFTKSALSNIEEHYKPAVRGE
ncbi:MAG: 50S ribosomal protein L4 [Spirochaetes bacterium]|nr:50S ribosomal protein L4 [Spirochaetota bacterium]MCK5266949.1 50S ribosomal protein L4 [Spirochaetota bacterium]